MLFGVLLSQVVPDSGTLLALTAVLAACLLTVVLTRTAPPRHARVVAVRVASVRDHTRRVPVLRVDDPDAPGHHRPRAPGLRSPAA